MIALHEVTDEGVRTIEVYADDVEVVSSLPRRRGAQIRTIDGRVFHVREDVAEVFTKLEESDGDHGNAMA